METEAQYNIEDLLNTSSLYREFQAEREEVIKHRFIESEKAGFDIGFERALTDWIVKHRAKWRKGREQKNLLDQIRSRGLNIELFCSIEEFMNYSPISEADYQNHNEILRLKGDYVLNVDNRLARTVTALPSSIKGGVITTEYNSSDFHCKVHFQGHSFNLEFKLEI